MIEPIPDNRERIMATTGINDIIYMFAMSLDGFIAREDGTFDWLDNFPPDDDYDFSAFMASLSGIVMGRATYDVVSREPEWAYAQYPCLVATSRPLDNLPENAEAMAGTPAEMLANLRARGAKGRIWLLGGGDLARQFMDAGLLDTIEIGTIPVILGSGLQAFGGKQADRWLDLAFAKPLANGAVHAQYRVRR
jgi:dihydrofolate reductase